MYAKRCAAFILLVVIVGLVNATENYMDYGGKLSSYSCSTNYLLKGYMHRIHGILIHKMCNNYFSVSLKQLFIFFFLME